MRLKTKTDYILLFCEWIKPYIIIASSSWVLKISDSRKSKCHSLMVEILAKGYLLLPFYDKYKHRYL